MFKTAINNNIIPHIWNLANIVPIANPQKHRQLHLIHDYTPPPSNYKDTREGPSSLHNSNHTNTPTQHVYKTQHSRMTALHTLNNTVVKGFYQMALPARTITLALDMIKTFDIINIHTLIRKLLQTRIPDTVIKLIANYIKGRKA